MKGIVGKYLEYINKGNTRYKIYIIRHGETLWNTQKRYQGSKDSSLTPNGLSQAKSIRDFLCTKSIEIIYSSPLSRALETAKIIAKECTLSDEKIISIDEFSERNFGCFEGQTKDKMLVKYQSFFKSHRPNEMLFKPYPNGESSLEMYCRSLPKILYTLHEFSKIVIVGHSNINRIIRGVLKNIPFEDYFELNQKSNEIIEITIDGKTDEVIHTI